MPAQGFRRNIRPWNILTDAEAEQIHSTSLSILEKTGVIFQADWALDVLEDAGCWVDRSTKRVRFPSRIVEQCLALCPRSFIAGARDPQRDLTLGGEMVCFSHTAGFQTIDLETFAPRPPTRQDYIECVTVLDALPSISHLSCYPYFGYEGVHPDMGILVSVAMKMRYSSKHQFICYQKGSEQFAIPMAQACHTEVTGTVTATPPLMWAEDALNVVRRMVAAGFPLATVDGYTLGATAPATIPGEVALANAHHLSMIVLVQVMHPGHRISVGHFASVLNMSTGSPVFGDVGAAVSNAFFNHMWRRYGIPCGNGSPGYVSAKTMDYQAGYEKAIGVLMSALSGADYILFHLGVSSEMAAHPVQAVLDDDVAGMVGFILAGTEVNDETLAESLIHSVGPIPGHFLDSFHTLKYWRTSQYMPKCADRLTYPEWLERGQPASLDYARARLQAILESHTPLPLPPAQEEEVERILREAEAYYRGRE
ncbi:MAG: trimethylamine methyltransferase family protein [Anaerolineae bacterium]